MIAGNGMVYSLPKKVSGVLYRGVISAEEPHSLLRQIDPNRWVVLHCQHCAQPPHKSPVINLYQIDAFYAHTVRSEPHVLAICRDFACPTMYRPLETEKKFDVVFNACWHDVKRPLLWLNALKYAKTKGRPISCVWYGYHWQSPHGWGTKQAIEDIVRREIKQNDLPIEILETKWDFEENNRRFNSARMALLTSKSEAGPRVMSEAMLADIPYLTCSNTLGGSPAYLTPANKNGRTCGTTPDSIAEAVWNVLDNLSFYEPRKWALANMCRPVANERMKVAVRALAEAKGWTVNIDEIDHDGSTFPEWWKPAVEANKAVA